MSAYPASYRWTDPFSPPQSPVRRGLRFALILAAHLGLLWAGLELASRPALREAAKDLVVRLVEAQPEIQPEPPKPKPQSAKAPVKPLPVLAATPESPAPAATFAVAPQPPAPPAAPPVATAPAAMAVTSARFDADYLSNPRPVYPTASRRLGEEGKVVLRVHVGADGAALAVEVKHSCGFPRLDEAARAAVERWRFVPAKRGDEPVASWVAVPIVFSLQNS